MPCPKCKGRLIWKERSWTTAGEDPGHWSCIMCGKLVYPEKVGLPGNPQSVSSAEVVNREREDEGPMSYHLDSKKEEEVKILLKTNSVREIVTKTGVAKATIKRIRDENFTKEERAELTKRALVEGWNKRKLEKREPGANLQNEGQNIPKIIPSADRDGKGGKEIMTEETQTCTNPKCPKPNPQPIDEFNKNAARPGGRETRCRTCTAKAQRDWIAKTAKKGRHVGGDGRRNRRPRVSVPVRVPRADLDQQLAIDLKTIKKRVAAEVLQIYHEGGQRAVEEAFA